MNVVQYVECPYCGSSESVRMEVETYGCTEHKVIACGCDRLYVASFRLELEVSTLKIEGEQARYDAFEDACQAEIAAAEQERELGIFGE